MRECLAKNMIKKANFPKIFLIQVRWCWNLVEYTMGRNLVKFKKIDDVISNLKVWRHNGHFDVSTTKEVESLHCFFVFGWIKLKFGVGGNFRLLISNLNSKTQYQFQILRKCHFSSLRSPSPLCFYVGKMPSPNRLKPNFALNFRENRKISAVNVHYFRSY